MNKTLLTITLLIAITMSGCIGGNTEPANEDTNNGETNTQNTNEQTNNGGTSADETEKFEYPEDLEITWEEDTIIVFYFDMRYSELIPYGQMVLTGYSEGNKVTESAIYSSIGKASFMSNPEDSTPSSRQGCMLNGEETLIAVYGGECKKSRRELIGDEDVFALCQFTDKPTIDQIKITDIHTGELIKALNIPTMVECTR